MKTAITIWNNRISPVFESAEKCIIVESSGNSFVQDEQCTLPKDSIQKKADLLRNKKVTSIICGAITKESEDILLQCGLNVFSYVAGELNEVLNGFLCKSILHKDFSMPGCGCPKRRCRSQKRYGWIEK